MFSAKTVLKHGQDCVRKNIRKRDYLDQMTRAAIDFFTMYDSIASRDYSAAHYVPILNTIAERLRSRAVR